MHAHFSRDFVPRSKKLGNEGTDGEGAVVEGDAGPLFLGSGGFGNEGGDLTGGEEGVFGNNFARVRRLENLAVSESKIQSR